MNVPGIVAIATTFSLSSFAFAADNGGALSKKHGCDTCHGVVEKLVGPAYKEIAAKYKGNKEAQALLEEKVRHGGSGVWGKMPMPPVSMSVSDENIKVIVQWVLTLK